MISIQKLASQLGVSTATISRALTPQYAHKVRPETRKRILELCNQYNYRPNITGRSFVTGKTYKIGVILGDLQYDFGSPLFGIFMHNFCSTLQVHGYNATILYAGADNNLESNAIEFLRSSGADAYLLGAALIDTKLEDVVKKSHCPVITYNPNCKKLNNLDSIYRNLSPAYSQAWQRIPENEQNNTAFIHGLNDKFKMQPLAQSAPDGIFFDDISLSSNFRYQDLNDFTELYNLTNTLQQYSVLWCASDLIAFNIYNALRMKGTAKEKMPKIIGFDNAEDTLESKRTPFLSTIDPCWSEMGKKAAKLLLDKIDNKITESETEIEAKLILRETF